MQPSVFVINLSNLEDRWSECKRESKKWGIELTRITAVDSNHVTSVHFTTKNIAACWESHKLAMSHLLSSNADYALILEDDFEILNPELLLLLDDFRHTGLDFLQVGFLTTSIREGFYIVIENCYDYFIRIYGIAENLFTKSRVSAKKLVRERKNLNRRFVLSDIRPGAHAYLLNRNAAKYFFQVNNPIFLSADDVFMAAGPMRSIKMARLRKSIVSQSGSVSSIRN